MNTHHFSVVVEGQAGLPLWALEHSARLLATETYDNANSFNGHRRMLTRPVALICDGQLIDRLDAGGWLSGYQDRPD
jgi:hypothetical protein